MRKILTIAILVLVAFWLLGGSIAIVKHFIVEREFATREEEILPKGEVLAYTDYIGISGKTYRVPIISDGKGGESRWMGDVLWADLPIENRLGFALRGGGLLGEKDMLELWLKFGEWRKGGKYYSLLLGEPKE